MLKRILYVCAVLMSALGVSGTAKADGWPNNQIAFGAASLMDQSLLILTLPSPPQVNSLLGQLSLPKPPQLAFYVAPNASKVVAISLSCYQVDFVPFIYGSYQEYYASGKGNDGQTYYVHLTTPSTFNNSITSGLVSPWQRAGLPPQVAAALGLVDLQLTALSNTGFGAVTDVISESFASIAGISNVGSGPATPANFCGANNVHADWVLQGTFAFGPYGQ